MLTLDQMKQIVRDHFEDFVNGRNAAVIHKNMAPDFYDHDGPGGRSADANIDERMMLNMYKAMPDLHLTIEDMIAEGDKVVCRNIWRWTDPASGKKMQFHGFVFPGSMPNPKITFCLPVCDIRFYGRTALCRTSSTITPQRLTPRTRFMELKATAE
jgi:predicted ester cyclase